jgi:hypothetical protein
MIPLFSIYAIFGKYVIELQAFIAASIRNALLFLCFLLFFFSLQAQNDEKTQSIKIKKERIVLLNDTIHGLFKDTTLLIPDSISYRLIRKKKIRNSSFYDSLYEKAMRSKITKEAYNLLFIKPVQVSTFPSDTNDNIRSESLFERFENKTISQIHIKRLDVFGTGIYDTHTYENPWINRVGNNIHIKTRKNVIRNNLLFTEGDALEPFALAESERLLRALVFLEDARLIVENDTLDSSYVHVFVLTKDVWSLGLGYKMISANSYRIAIYDKNLLGLGSAFDNNMRIYTDGDQMINYDGIYTVNNISGTFIEGNLRHINDYNQEYSGLELNRTFLSPGILYGGGLKINRNNEFEEKAINDSTIKRIMVQSSIKDFWIGRSFPVSAHKNDPLNLILSFKYKNKTHYKRPIPDPDTNLAYQDYNLFLIQATLSKNKYYKSTRIYSFGRTEDIPYGMLLQANVGLKNEEFRSKIYTGLRFSSGVYANKIGYFFWNAAIGTFFYKHSYDQLSFEIKKSFFSRLISLKNWDLRQFLSAVYTLGLERYEDEYIRFENDKNIRGLKLEQLFGQQRLIATYESVFFTPYQFLGFRFAFFLFSDMGLLGSNKESIFKNELYAGYGLGFRLRNEHLIFRTFEIRLGYYPRLPENNEHWRYNVSGESLIQMDNFIPRAPGLMEFK